MEFWPESHLVLELEPISPAHKIILTNPTPFQRNSDQSQMLPRRPWSIPAAPKGLWTESRHWLSDCRISVHFSPTVLLAVAMWCFYHLSWADEYWESGWEAQHSPVPWTNTFFLFICSLIHLPALNIMHFGSRCSTLIQSDAPRAAAPGWTCLI